MRKFFVDNINKDKTVSINDVNHIKNVLRCKIGKEIEVCTNDGTNFLCSIKEINENEVVCDILEELLKDTEPKNKITLFQGLPKADKMEYIIEKCTEIGVHEFTPVIMNRTIVKLDEKEKLKKVERWQKIAETASKQSKRNIIPKINNIIILKDLIEIFENYDIILIAYENEKINNIKYVLENINLKQEGLNIGILIGPEGGIGDEEISILRNDNVKIVHLGNRILRTETAGLITSAIVLFELGDMN